MAALPFTARWIQPSAFGRFGFGPDTFPAIEGVWNGRHWGRISGGHNMRAAEGGAVPDQTSRLCGTSDGDTTDITTWEGSYVPVVGTRVAMRIVGVGATGVEDYDSEPVTCEVVARTEGRTVLALPNPVRNLVVKPNSDGTFTLAWFYSPTRQGVAPTHFNIYANTGSGDAVDYDNALDTEAYVVDKSQYSFTTEAIVGSTRETWLFGVRAEGADDAEEKNTFVASTVGTPETAYDAVEATPAGTIPTIDPK